MNTPSLEIIVVLGLAVLALLFFGYQLDDIYRRIKEIELNQEALCTTSMSTDTLLGMYSKDITNLQESLISLEEKLKPKPKGKVGRPRKVINGKNDNP